MKVDIVMEYEFDHSATRITKMTGSKANGKIKHLLLFTFYVNNKPNTVPEMTPFSPVLPF